MELHTKLLGLIKISSNIGLIILCCLCFGAVGSPDPHCNYARIKKVYAGGSSSSTVNASSAAASERIEMMMMMMIIENVQRTKQSKCVSKLVWSGLRVEQLIQDTYV